MSVEKIQNKNGTQKAENQALPEKQADNVIFHATLYPYRSLNRKGFTILMAALFTLTSIISIYFYSKGAWPVVGFMGLELVIIWFAFRASYLSAHDYETVTLTDTELIIEDHTRNKPYKRWTFNPAWVRITMDDPPEHESQLTITSHGKGVVIGNFLSPQERLDLANTLRQHVNKCRT